MAPSRFQGAGCFLFAATGMGWTADNRAILGSISDDPYDIRTFVRALCPERELAHLGTELVSTSEHTLEERGYPCRPYETTRAVNEAGLAFTCAGVFERGDVEPATDPVFFMEATSQMLGKCRSVDDAIDHLASVGPTSFAWNVLLADAEGHIAKIEIGKAGFAVVERYSPADPGVLVSVNCFIEMAEYNDSESLLSNLRNNNACRLETGVALANRFKGELDPHTLSVILADHTNLDRDPNDNPVLDAWGYSICNHGTRGSDTYPYEDLPWGTVSAEILEPSHRRLWYAYGWPCGHAPSHGDQIYQEGSWGKFIAFELPDTVETGPYTTVDGQVTSLGAQNIAERGIISPAEVGLSLKGVS